MIILHFGAKIGTSDNILFNHSSVRNNTTREQRNIIKKKGTFNKVKHK